MAGAWEAVRQPIGERDGMIEEPAGLDLRAAVQASVKQLESWNPDMEGLCNRSDCVCGDLAAVLMIVRDRLRAALRSSDVESMVREICDALLRHDDYYAERVRRILNRSH